MEDNSKKEISAFEFDILIKNSTNTHFRGYRVKDMHFEGGNKSINFVDCIFYGTSLFSHIIASNPNINLIFINCIFQKAEDWGLVRFNNLSLEDIYFEHCLFDCELEFDLCTSTNITLLNSQCKRIGINNCATTSFRVSRIRGNKSTIECISVISDSSANTLDNFHLTNCEVVDLVDFNYFAPKFVEIIGGKYGKFDISHVRNAFRLNIAGDSVENKLLIENLNVSKNKMDNEVIVKFAKIKVLDISEFLTGASGVRFHGIEIDGEAYLNDSDFRFCKFNDINFLNTKIVFDGSSLEGIIFSNIQWYPNQQIYSLGELTSQNELSGDINNRREAYRQLKKVSNAQGNRIDALLFYKNEMNEYWNYIRNNSKIARSEKFLIRVNRYVSNFGQDWIKPLRLIIYVNIITFLILLFSSYFPVTLTLNIDQMTLESFSKGIGLFINLLNPLSKSDYQLNAWLTLIFLNKIITGFLIYHFVKATRKHGVI